MTKEEIVGNIVIHVLSLISTVIISITSRLSSGGLANAEIG
jgi:hypothetical protein